jgi:hypothetical protein
MSKISSKELKNVHIWLGVLSALVVILFITVIAKFVGLGSRIDSVSANLSDSFTQTHDFVKAKEFLLVDAAGNTMARLRVTATTPEAAALVLSDKDSNSTVRLAIINHVPQFSLTDKNGSNRVVVGLTPDKQEQTFLTLSDKDGNSTVELGVQGSRASGLFLYGPNGMLRSHLSLTNDRPSLCFFDKKGNARISMGVTSIFSPDGSETKTSESAIYMFGPDGKSLWRAP